MMDVSKKKKALRNAKKFINTVVLCLFVPGKRGTRNTISAKMHPAAHISTPVEYSGAPNNSSGLRYHLSKESKVVM